MLEFRNVSVSCQHMPILNDISLTFRDGEITTILGPNGCGKTTLVQCLNGASTVTAGQIFLNGQDFLKISPKERAREISLLPQVRTIIPAIPVKMLVEHGRFPYLGFSRRKSKEDTEIVNRAMEFTHISQYADQYVDTLSGGIRQRVFFAMVLAQDCDYIVLDEPTTYLDLTGQREFYAMIKELKKQGKTIILILHDLSQAVRISDTLVVMNRAGSRSLDEAAHAGTDSDVKATDFPSSIAMVGTPQECLQSHVIEDVFQTSWKRFTDEDVDELLEETDLIYKGMCELVVKNKTEEVLDEIKQRGIAFDDLPVIEKARMLQFQPDNNSYNIQLYSAVCKVCGVDTSDEDKIFEDYQAIYEKTLEMKQEQVIERNDGDRERAR